MIKTVIRCPDDTVMAFDEKGDMLPLYLGQYQTVKMQILKDSNPGTVYSHYFDNESVLVQTTLEAW
ncbi:MAG: hypothetical protein JW712_10885 [Dehalococcoidales bacterium]|nr:hypothetical protein [Dehalococcoidales bacterium]